MERALEEEEEEEFSLPEGHILYRFETTSGAVWVVLHHTVDGSEIPRPTT